MTKKSFRTDKAPAPAATYSQAVRKGNMLQVAGQVGFIPSTGKLVDDTVGGQTKQTMANLEAILAEAGSSIDDVIMLRVFLTDAAHFAEMNEVFADHVRDPFPARTTVFTGLAPGVLVEIDALAVLD
jgi:reactive intermediate/imine deaminase